MRRLTPILLLTLVSQVSVAQPASELRELNMSPQLATYFEQYGVRQPTNAGVNNLAIGHEALKHIAKATENFNLGNPPVEINAITSGGENVAVGKWAMRESRYSSDCTAVGTQAMRDNFDAYYNTGIGHYALGFNINGWKNTAVGAFAMQGIEGDTNANENTCIGFRCGELVENAQYNVGVGDHALLKIVDSIRNAGVGSNVFQQLTGDQNACLGSSCGATITTGDRNTCVGEGTCDGITTGSGNSIFGRAAGLSSSLTNNIILANGAQQVKAQHDGTNWTLTGNVSTTGAWIPPTLADGAAPNNSVYYSSTGSKLSYKDAGGTVHALH